jgi:hypothetical protein
MGTGTPYARRLAVAAYLYSLTREAPGVPAPVLIAATFTPSDDYNVLAKALDGLESSAWYLHTDARGYRFSTEASLVKLVHEAERQVSPGRAKQAATDILGGVFKDSALKVKRTWEDAKVPDRDDDAWLVLLHWDEFGDAHGVGSVTEAVPRQVRELWEKTAAGGVREYRNRLVLLLPSSLNHEPMLRTVRRHLALHDLLGSPDTVRSLPDEKKKELAGLGKESELLARIAICNHVNILYVPLAQGLEAVELDVVTQASAKQNQTDAILERLAAMEKTLTAGDRPLDPAYIRSKLGEQMGRPMPTIDLVRAFARRTDLKMVLDRAQISALVISGVRNGVWEYQDAERGERGWATKDTPSFSPRLAEDTLICPLGSAPPPSPIGLVLPPLPPKTPSGSLFEAGGNAGVAVRQAREKAADAGQLNLLGLTVTIDEVGAGTAASLAKLLSVVPPGTPGVSLIYEVNAQVDLGSPDHRLSISFVGPAAEYQPLKSALDHVLRQHQAALKASLIATFNPQLALAGEAVEGIRRRAADTGPEKCLVKMTTSRGD